jgi:hypothetical protein
MITPQRRQEIALGAMVVGALVAAGATLLGVRTWRRRRQLR